MSGYGVSEPHVKFIHISGKQYELMVNHKDAWNADQFRERYSEVVARYDYIVGDIGYEKLRLKGFFEDGHAQGTPSSVFSSVTDYLNEYCAFGCPYFILRNRTGAEGEGSRTGDVFLSEVDPSERVAAMEASIAANIAKRKERPAQPERREGGGQAAGNRDRGDQRAEQRPNSRVETHKEVKDRLSDQGQVQGRAGGYSKPPWQASAGGNKPPWRQKQQRPNAQPAVGHTAHQESAQQQQQQQQNAGHQHGGGHEPKAQHNQQQGQPGHSNHQKRPFFRNKNRRPKPPTQA